MTGDDLQSRQQTQERLCALHRAVNDAVDKLSRFYNSVETNERLYFRDSVDVKVRHIRDVRQVAKDLALAASQTRALFDNAELSAAHSD